MSTRPSDLEDHLLTKGSSLGVLNRIWEKARLLLSGVSFDDSLTRKLREHYSEVVSASSGQLLEWLDSIREKLSEERVSDSLGDVFGLPNSRIDKTDLCGQVIDAVKRISNRGTLCKATEETVCDLVKSSLGLVFIRYNKAVRESYYHWLLSDLLPDNIRVNLMESLSIPEGAGTVGWIVEDAIRELNEKQEPKNSTAHNKNSTAHNVWSCFIDPKGRVATEDIIAGNRSFIGVPILEKQSGTSDVVSYEPVGVLFCFLPFDGAFATTSDSDLNLFTKLKTEFSKLVEDFQNELLLAISAENAELLFNTSRVQASDRLLSLVGQSYDQSELLDKYQASFLRTNLFGEDSAGHSYHKVDTSSWRKVYPGDPLGFQIAIQAEERGVGHADTSLPLALRGMIRKGPFVNKLFGLLNLSCLFPDKWTTLTAHAINRLLKLYGATAEGQPSLPVLPVWFCRGGEDRMRGPIRFEESDVKVDSCLFELLMLDNSQFREDYLTILERFDEEFESDLRNLYFKLDEFQTERGHPDSEKLDAYIERELEEQSNDGENRSPANIQPVDVLEEKYDGLTSDDIGLRQGIKLFSENRRSRIVDLFVPLVIHVDEIRDDDDFVKMFEEILQDDEQVCGLGNQQWASGYIRLLVIRDREEDNLSRLKYHRLYRLFPTRNTPSHDQPQDSGNYQDHLAFRVAKLMLAFRLSFRCLEKGVLHQRLGGNGTRDSFSLLKMLVDLRTVACRSIVSDLQNSLTGSPGRDFDLPEHQLSTFIQAIQLSPLPNDLKKLFEKLAEDVQRSLEPIHYVDSHALPEIALASIWLCRSRAVIQSYSENEKNSLVTLLSKDRGLAQALRLFVRLTRLCHAPEDGSPIKWSWYPDNENRNHKFGDHIVFLPPVVTDQIAATKRPYVNFEYDSHDQDIILSTFYFNEDSNEPDITVRWKWERFPEPEQIAPNHACAESSLFDFLSSESPMAFTEPYRNEKISDSVELSLQSVFQNLESEADATDFNNRIEGLIDFISSDSVGQDNSSRDVRQPKSWRQSVVDVEGHRITTFVYADVNRVDGDSRFDLLRQLRNSVVRGVTSDLTLLLNTANNFVREQEKRRIRFLSHSLKGVGHELRVPKELIEIKLEMMKRNSSLSGNSNFERVVELWNSLEKAMYKQLCISECITSPLAEGSIFHQPLRSFLERVFDSYVYSGVKRESFEVSIDLDDIPNTVWLRARSKGESRYSSYASLFLILSNLVRNAAQAAIDEEVSDKQVGISAKLSGPDSATVSVWNTPTRIPAEQANFLVNNRINIAPLKRSISGKNRRGEGLETVRRYLREQMWWPPHVEYEYEGNVGTTISFSIRLTNDV